MARRAARRWEAAALAGYRRRNRDKNPRYDKTRSGGRRYWNRKPRCLTALIRFGPVH